MYIGIRTGNKIWCYQVRGDFIEIIKSKMKILKIGIFSPLNFLKIIFCTHTHIQNVDGWDLYLGLKKKKNENYLEVGKRLAIKI